MYKKSIMLAAALALTPQLAQADTVLGVYVGGHYWDTDISGEYGVGSDVISSDFDSEGQESYYAVLEHPVPFIPNVKIRENSLEFDGDYGRNDFSHRDYIFYYEFFDNDIISFDIGVNAMDFDGTARTPVSNTFGRQSFSVTIPTAYLATRVGIPMTELTFFAEASGLSVKDSKVQDAQVGVEYRLIENLAVDLNLHAGYRHSVIELDNVDDIDSDVTFKGPFVGLEVHF